jgi:hypothetical protein
MTILRAVNGSCRCIMPPLMKPGSVGPWFPLGPDMTSVLPISGIGMSCQPNALS